MKPSKPLSYSLLDEMCASPTQPMSQQKRTYTLTKLWAALASIEAGPAPTANDWRLCSDAVNMTETLVETLKVCEDSSGLLHDATNALAYAALRHQETGAPIRLDGPGIIAVRAILEDYAEAIAHLPHRTMIRCHRLTERRIREIRMGKKLSHDVQVVSIG